MPFYIRNKLKITGDSDQMEDLLIKSKGKINFVDLFPIPEGLDDDQCLMFKVKTWGTKGLIANEDDEETMERLNYKVKHDINGQVLSMQVTFDTAFTPPLLYFYDLQDLYPKLKFYLKYDDYFEESGTAQTRFKDDVPYFDISEYFLWKGITGLRMKGLEIKF